jgi:uncharacterized Ntn-hydrolase superfamily protein
MAEISYGPLGLDLMREGKGAPEALEQLLAADDGRDHRQVAFVDARGRVATHTGSRCLFAAGDRTGEGYSVQANMMRNPTVWDAMAGAYESGLAAGLDLADRLLSALDAAEAEGGDVRGRQAAGILIVRGTPSGKPWEDVRMNLRVDDHPDPLVELRRLAGLRRAYDRLEDAERFEMAGDLEGALAEHRAALAMQPDSPEIAFWTAVALAGLDHVDEARSVIEVAYDADPGWPELLKRLADGGFLTVEPGALERLLPAD